MIASFARRALGLGTALSVALLPVAASAAEAQIPSDKGNGAAVLETSRWSVDAETANRYRGYGRHRHRDRIDGGDILAGVLILGGIAAIAGASSKSNERSDRYDRRSSSSYDDAADQCSRAAERQAGSNARVDRVTGVSREGSGWRVAGELTSSRGVEGFQCGVSNNGRIDYLQIDASRSGRYGEYSVPQQDDRDYSQNDWTPSGGY